MSAASGRVHVCSVWLCPRLQREAASTPAAERLCQRLQREAVSMSAASGCAHVCSVWPCPHLWHEAVPTSAAKSEPHKSAPGLACSRQAGSSRLTAVHARDALRKIGHT